MNARPSEPQSDALPTELYPPCESFQRTGLTQQRDTIHEISSRVTAACRAAAQYHSLRDFVRFYLDRRAIYSLLCDFLGTRKHLQTLCFLRLSNLNMFVSIGTMKHEGRSCYQQGNPIDCNEAHKAVAQRLHDN